MFIPTLGELQDKLLILTYVYSYRSGFFTLTSGRSSHYYIDGKQVVMAPEGLHATAQYILASMRQHRVQAEAVGGPTLGADPIAAAVTVLSEIWSKNIPGGDVPAPLISFIVRKETKGHGTRSQIEGPFHRGMRVVLVDDVLTTGGSVLKAAAAVEAAGGEVSTVYVLVDRLEGGREAIEKAGYLLEAAVDRSALDRLQQEMERRYPDLSRSLQAEKVSWSRLPLDEVQAAGYPVLAGALEELARAIETAAGDNLLNRARLQHTAGRFFSSVKAAEYHPAGETEALRLVQLTRSTLAR